MLLIDKKEFFKELKSLMVMYGKKADPDIFGIWFNLFEEYELPDIKNAFVSYAKTSSYPPVPASVLKFLNGRIYDVLAEEAWEHVPKLESESGYVTKRMMRALGVAEESIALGDTIGARISFVKTYNSLPEDNDFYYSEAYGVDYDDKEQRKIDAYKLLENKGWMTKKDLIMLKPAQLLMIENGSGKTLTESEKTRGKKCASTILEMLTSSQKNTGKE